MRARTSRPHGRELHAAFRTREYSRMPADARVPKRSAQQTLAVPAALNRFQSCRADPPRSRDYLGDGLHKALGRAGAKSKPSPNFVRLAFVLPLGQSLRKGVALVAILQARSPDWPSRCHRTRRLDQQFQRTESTHIQQRTCTTIIQAKTFMSLNWKKSLAPALASLE